MAEQLTSHRNELDLLGEKASAPKSAKRAMKTEYFIVNDYLVQAVVVTA